MGGNAGNLWQPYSIIDMKVVAGGIFILSRPLQDVQTNRCISKNIQSPLIKMSEFH